MNVITDKLNQERVEVLAFPTTVFAPVLCGTTHFALKYVQKQYQKAIGGQLSACNGYSNLMLSMPCAHLIKAHMAIASSLEMTDFDV